MGAIILLVAAGFVAGTMNAAAGGGSFITLPALILTGLPSVTANASSTVALFPGGLVSFWAFRRDLSNIGGTTLWPLLVVSVAGGAGGALLLLWTSSAIFDAIIPWLLLLATLAFAFGPAAGAALRRVVRIGRAPVLAGQFLLSIYGGYFGGALGIMMMAVWSLMAAQDIKSLNPAKTLMVAATNAVAVLCFVAGGAVRWPDTIAVGLGAAAGGYLGARLAQRISARHLRAAVVIVTATITIVIFLRRG